MNREGPKSGIVRAPRTRRSSVKIDDRGGRGAFRDAMRSGLLAWAIAASLTFTAICAVIANVTRARPLVAVGQVMNDTRLVRLPFEIEDERATADARQLAQDRTPRVYAAEQAVLERLDGELRALPRTLAGVESLEQVEDPIRRAFALTPESFNVIRAEATAEGEASGAWILRVDRFMDLLKERPLLDAAAWQAAMIEGKHVEVEVIVEGASRVIPKTAVINQGEPVGLQETTSTLARRAGFTAVTIPTLVARLTQNPTPTFRFDADATASRQAHAVSQVAPRTRTMRVGDVIYARENVLTQAQLDLLLAESANFAKAAPLWRVAIRIVSVTCAVAAVTLAIAGYIRLFCPKIARRPGRMWGLGALLAGCLAVGCWGTLASPSLIMLTGVAPTVFAAIILVVAYDQRVALAIGILHGLLVCISLDQRVGMLAVIVTGIGAAVWGLHEIRDRRTIVRTAVRTGVGLAVSTVLVSLIDRPIIAPSIRQAGIEAALAGFGGLLVGGVTLFILPTIERVFGITTGMTLFELRDPKQPLLRQLQQRAPGTYNHSLTVASIAEAAADAIGANGLLAYVGSLYHDIGKMNKPEYFVENQSGGPSKHDKLSPAMSLLVIVGHVKDGVEMGREAGLPDSILHFIEAHHGTTLVEFFYDRARRLAEEAGDEPAKPPEEIEYRYPGPKPQSKEVAILMLADAVESATRSMQEPTPSRIDSLVRSLANKRLLDGQFDECELTLRELGAITESMSKTVTSVFHGRISYQSTSGLKPRPARGA